MVNFQMVKSPVRWTFFILVVGSIAVVIWGIDYTLSFLNIHVSRLIISIVAGLFSGAILIAFDIIVFQGVEYEEGQREQRMKLILTEVMYSDEVRRMIRYEIKKALEEKKT